MRSFGVLWLLTLLALPACAHIAATYGRSTEVQKIYERLEVLELLVESKANLAAVDKVSL